jgi:hypothetical protein
MLSRSFLVVLCSLFLLSSHLSASDSKGFDNLLEGEIKQEISSYLIGNSSLCKSLTLKESDDDGANNIGTYSCKVPKKVRNKKPFSLFIKVTKGPREFENLKKVEQYVVQSEMQKQIESFLCLPVTMKTLQIKQKEYSILIFPKVKGCTLDKLMSKLKKGKIEASVVEDLYTQLGSAVGVLHKLGGLKVSG